MITPRQIRRATPRTPPTIPPMAPAERPCPACDAIVDPVELGVGVTLTVLIVSAVFWEPVGVVGVTFMAVAVVVLLDTVSWRTVVEETRTPFTVAVLTFVPTVVVVVVEDAVMFPER
jgi:hypothetical protein